MDNPDSDVPYFASTEWLAGRLRDPAVVVVDVRPPFFFSQGHIPGATNLPAFFLAGPTGGPPDPGLLAPRLGAAGIGRRHHVIAYDDGANAQAARLLWVLNFYAHPRASLLDGGITLWAHQDRPLHPGDSTRTAERYEVAQTDPSVIIGTEEVLASLGSPDSVIVDTRSPAEYLGYQATAQRDGHIPGAVNVDWTNNLVAGPDEIAHSRPDDELRELYESAGATPDKDIIVHCQSGVRASYTYAVLRRLGYPKVRNYAAGWQEWGNRTDTPVETA